MKILLAVLLIVLSVSVYSQSDSVYKFTLPELKITQLENGKDVTYGFAEERNMFLVRDTMLIADPNRYKYQVPVGNIRKLSILNGNSGWRAAKSGGIFGGALGVIIGVGISIVYGHDSNKSGLIIVIPAFALSGAFFGGLVGGILGSFVPYYENYSKFSDDAQAKKEILKRIFKKHNLR